MIAEIFSEGKMSFGSRVSPSQLYPHRPEVGRVSIHAARTGGDVLDEVVGHAVTASFQRLLRREPEGPRRVVGQITRASPAS